MKTTAAFFAVLVLMSSGCATPAKLKTVKEEKLYFSSQTSESKKQARREELVSRHTEWPETVRQSALKGEVLPGMTTAQVLVSLGKPLEILRTTNEGQRDHALWIYSTAYLIFDEDILTSREEVVKIDFKYSMIEKNLQQPEAAQ